MRPNPIKSSGLLFALGIVGAAACSQNIMDSGSRSSRIVLDVSSILGGDFVSVLDTARLTISAGGEERTLTRRFGSGDSETSFEVSVKPGPATFGIEVVSDSGTALYRGETTATIDADGFVVDLIPVAVNPVMVVSPGHPAFKQTDNGQVRTFTATVHVRSAGLDTLKWRVEARAGVSVFCYIPNLEWNCLEETAWTAAWTSLNISVGFTMPIGGSLPTSGIRFLSNVGSALLPTVP
jgi:hypothetical protein